MGYNLTVTGWGTFEGMIKLLELMKVEVQISTVDAAYYVSSYDHETRSCRKAVFVNPVTNQPSVLEEYMAYETDDCDGQSIIDVALYPVGQRPDKLDKYWRRRT